MDVRRLLHVGIVSLAVSTPGCDSPQSWSQSSATPRARASARRSLRLHFSSPFNSLLFVARQSIARRLLYFFYPFFIFFPTRKVYGGNGLLAIANA